MYSLGPIRGDEQKLGVMPELCALQVEAVNSMEVEYSNRQLISNFVQGVL